MKDLKMAAAIFAGVCGALMIVAGVLFISVELRAAEPKPLKVLWIGHPVVDVSNDPEEASLRSIGAVQIGLREDGVIVWRQVGKNESIR